MQCSLRGALFFYILKKQLMYCILVNLFENDFNPVFIRLFTIFADIKLSGYITLMSDTFSDSHQVKVVSTFSELVNTHFQGMMNAACWYRNLDGDFKEIVSKLQLDENITEISREDLLALQLSENGNAAREIILNDLQLLTDFESTAFS